VATGPGGGGGGGGGCYVKKTYTTGQLTGGASVAVTIGTGGAVGQGWRDGGLGAKGKAIVTWT
jgi:hypothetical protein